MWLVVADFFHFKKSRWDSAHTSKWTHAWMHYEACRIVMAQDLLSIVKQVSSTGKDYVNRSRVEAKLLRYSSSEGVLVLSDGREHVFADFAPSNASSSLASLQNKDGPFWVVLTDFEVSSCSLFGVGAGSGGGGGGGGRRSLQQHDARVTVHALDFDDDDNDDGPFQSGEVITTSNHPIRARLQEQEVLLSQPWDLVGPIELNASNHRLASVLVAVVASGQAFELGEVLRWSNKARAMVAADSFRGSGQQGGDSSSFFGGKGGGGGGHQVPLPLSGTGGAPLLHTAAYFGRVECLRLLLDCCINKVFGGWPDGDNEKVDGVSDGGTLPIFGDSTTAQEGLIELIVPAAAAAGRRKRSCCDDRDSVGGSNGLMRKECGGGVDTPMGDGKQTAFYLACQVVGDKRRRCFVSFLFFSIIHAHAHTFFLSNRR
jgi:hypothetical protein